MTHGNENGQDLESRPTAPSPGEKAEQLAYLLLKCYADNFYEIRSAQEVEFRTDPSIPGVFFDAKTDRDPPEIYIGCEQNADPRVKKTMQYFLQCLSEESLFPVGQSSQNVTQLLRGVVRVTPSMGDKLADFIGWQTVEIFGSRFLPNSDRFADLTAQIVASSRAALKAKAAELGAGKALARLERQPRRGEIGE